MKQEPFSKPLNEWVEEEVPVKKVRFDPKTNKTSSIYELEKVRTKYMDVPYEKVRCKDGTHEFEIKDTHKWIFSCKNCSYSRMVYPTTYNFVAGALIHRKTGRRV